MKYIQSEDYANYCQKYFEKYFSFSTIFMKYNKTFNREFDTAVQKSSDIEYAVGGKTIFLGYYHPSPIIDLVVSGVSRGHLMRRKDKGASYEYFILKNEVIAAHKLDGKITDRIVLVENNAFDKLYISKDEHECGSIVKCLYNSNGICSYTNVYCSTYSQFCEATEETYMYESNHIIEAHITQFLSNGSQRIIQHYNYHFFFDEYNFATHYSYEHYLGEMLIEKSNELCPTLAKRQI